MNGLPYYKAYPRDFIEGTVGMPLELKGAYRIILDLIYLHGGELPDACPEDTRYITGMLGCHHHKWHLIRNKLVEIGKITIDGGLIHNGRATRELASVMVTPPVTPPVTPLVTPPSNPQGKPARAKRYQWVNCPYTDTDTDTEKKEERRTPLPPLPDDAPTAPVLQPRASALDRPVRIDPNTFAGEFERVWSAYPRKVGKGNAAKAWAKARRTTEYETIAAPLRLFIRAVNGSDPQFVPHLATWLNGCRWHDEPDHAANRPRTSTTDLENLSRISSADDLAALMPTPSLRIIR